MRGKRRVVIKAATSISERCTDHWSVQMGAGPSALEALAASDEIEPWLNEDGQFDNTWGDDGTWSYCCRLHGTSFQPWSGCPKSNRRLIEGEIVELDAIRAETLVVGGYADYVREQARSNVSDEKLGRINDLLENMGLPAMSEEDLSVYDTVDKVKAKAHPRLKDRQLANELGLSDEDIADMKKLL